MDPAEINEYRSIVSEEIKRVNSQKSNANNSQETRWKHIKGTIDAAAKDLKIIDTGIKKKHVFNDEYQRTVKNRKEAKIKMLRNITPKTTKVYKFRKVIANKTLNKE